MSPLQRCRSCGAAIIWARTQKGKAIPVDPEAVNPPATGNILLVANNGTLMAKVGPAGARAAQGPLRHLPLS